MPRSTIPAQVKNRVLREFNHLCAVCGRPRPHIHHIDNNPSNNTDENLLPLCPNHHLLDAHDPTEQLPASQLLLFRKYRDPYILLSQFNPILKRLQFLFEPQISDSTFEELDARAKDLIAFVLSLKQGSYYSQRIAGLIGWKEINWPKNVIGSHVADAAAILIEAHKIEEGARDKYRQTLRVHKEQVVSLAVESLRYQEWRIIPQYGDA